MLMKPFSVSYTGRMPAMIAVDLSRFRAANDTAAQIRFSPFLRPGVRTGLTSLFESPGIACPLTVTAIKPSSESAKVIPSAYSTLVSVTVITRELVDLEVAYKYTGIGLAMTEGSRMAFPLPEFYSTDLVTLLLG